MDEHSEILIARHMSAHVRAILPLPLRFLGWLLLITDPVAGAEPTVLASFSSRESTASQNAWVPWSPRPEVAPACSTDPKVGRNGGGALKIETRQHGEIGGWQRRIAGVQPGRQHRFTGWYRAESVENERRSVIARVDWLRANGSRARPSDFPLDVARDGAWTKINLLTKAPEDAVSVEVTLLLAFATHATVWWDDVTLAVDDSPSKERMVRVMTIRWRPRGTSSSAESVEQFCALAEQAANQKPDIICLPEGISVIGTGKKYPDVGEPIPGPTTTRLGEVARKLRSYIVAGIYERAGNLVYNTAVLIGRDGKVAGSYRKTHLPTDEWWQGLTPGDSYPVFETDFGKIGLLICWDLQFPEPWRALALQGAELILLPIWGGSETLARARAMENHVFVVTSSYDMKNFVVDPAGEILAEATATSPVATAELSLDRKIYQWWIGNMGTRTWKERRGDLPWGSHERP